jgi:hypothetical protein
MVILRRRIGLGLASKAGRVVEDFEPFRKRRVGFRRFDRCGQLPFPLHCIKDAPAPMALWR